MILLALLACTPTPPPSVLLITIDTTRADHLGPYGYAGAETPTWDALAAEGGTWERAYSACPLTIPSHSTILTGRFPPSHGVRDNGDFLLSDDAVTLAERLKARGYATAAFTAAFPTQARWGFSQGFDVYHDPLERPPTELDWSDQRRAGDVVDDALATLPSLGDGPSFTWVHLFDAHWPYEPPEPFASRHEGRPYDGEIAYADHEAGRLLDEWDERHPDGVVIVTADHGEGLGDGGELTHGFLLHDGTIHVPLIVRGPGVAPGSRHPEPVSHVDLVPTVLAMLGLPGDERLQGRDLRAGGSGFAYSEALTGKFNLGLAPLFARTDADGRFTEGSHGDFYAADGDRVLTEPSPSPPGKAEALAALRARLDEVVAPEASLDAASLEMLAALGYLGGGDVNAPAGTVDPRDVIDVIPLTWRVRQALGQGAVQEAERMLDRLDRRMPGTFGVDLLRTQLQLRKGKVDEAVQSLTDLFLRSPSSTLALQLADRHAGAGQLEEARSWYEEALRLQPASPEAMVGVVRMDQLLGEDDLALDLADQYLLVYPDHVELVLVRAELEIGGGRPDLALPDALWAADREPRWPWAHAVLAQALWELGRPDESLDALAEALRLAPTDMALRVRLAENLLEVGRNAEAVRVAQPVARLFPDDDEAAALVARALAALARERSR